ncbi:3'-5' exonuclease family protein [Ferrimonas marina]|uniref:Exonuclease n=1 Tax=Ferrimonas marina TaxID=299255 RepID=A0A1M5U4Q8_9GAMM|nr:hypothetical protein [Ferrimonas marina]SHH57836.1 hypothetical protein SAMN02745129_2404 [Ferrimonas marina]
MTEAEVIWIDIEASGLEMASYPIEVGFASNTGSLRESFLIDPDTVPQGVDWTFWSTAAEGIHKIPREQLAGQLSVYEAAERLNSLLRGCRVLSDAQDFDRRWLDRLHAAAGVDPTYEVIGLSGWCLENRQNAWAWWLLRKGREVPHRALPDCDLALQLGRECEFWD